MNQPATIPALRACLETLQSETKRLNLPLAATLIGAACEALNDEITQSNAPIEAFVRQRA